VTEKDCAGIAEYGNNGSVVLSLSIVGTTIDSGSPGNNGSVVLSLSIVETTVDSGSPTDKLLFKSVVCSLSGAGAGCSWIADSGES
jgi:hypothetical protein